MINKKLALVLGAGGFIGSHLVKRLKENGYWVRGVDLKYPEYWDTFADEFIIGDLRDISVVNKAMFSPNQNHEGDAENSFDEVYQLAADMGGAQFVFTGEHDYDIMHNSALINLNVSLEAIKKRVKKLFYSSSACMYPEHNQLDPNNPNCEESSAYPANPDSEYGWEKLFSERIYLSANRNYGLDVRIARFHNIFGPHGTYKGGREKSPAAMCRKAVELNDGDEMIVWGTGQQTRSFLYIDECLEAVDRFMKQDNFMGPVNIGSEEMVTINQLAQMAIDISGKNIRIKNLYGDEFFKEYGYKCPIGVQGRNSDNRLYKKHMNWETDMKLYDGLKLTYDWIHEQERNISIIGVGKLGLCMALNLENSGFNIIGIDINQGYIDSLNNKTLKSPEPLVEEYLEKANNITFSTNMEDALKSDVIFVVVKTPSTPEWKYDVSQIQDVVDKLKSFGPSSTRKELVINCTTFPGDCDKFSEQLKDYNYYVSYNPEFIAQGNVMYDQVYCDSVLIGEADETAGNTIQSIYEQMCKSNPAYNRMTRTEAELTKIATNCFLTTKISYANMIGDIAKRLGCDDKKILTAVGTDKRINPHYLKCGFGYGGPCFPRDNRALAKCADEVGIDAIISKATDEMNEKHLEYQVEDFVQRNPDKSIPITFEYVTYKRDSVLLEESQQLKFALKLKELGYTINLTDTRTEVLDELSGIL